MFCLLFLDDLLATPEKNASFDMHVCEPGAQCCRLEEAGLCVEGWRLGKPRRVPY